MGYNSPWAYLGTVNRKPLDYGLSDGLKTPTMSSKSPKGCGNWSPAFCHFGCIELLDFLLAADPGDRPKS